MCMCTLFYFMISLFIHYLLFHKKISIFHYCFNLIIVLSNFRELDFQLSLDAFNSLAPERCSSNLKKCNFQTHLLEWYHDYFPVQIFSYECHRNHWQVNIGSGNGLVPSVNKPLPEPMLTQAYVAIWRHQTTIVNTLICSVIEHDALEEAMVNISSIFFKWFLKTNMLFSLHQWRSLFIFFAKTIKAALFYRVNIVANDDLGPVSLTVFSSHFKFDGNFVSLSSRD